MPESKPPSTELARKLSLVAVFSAFAFVVSFWLRPTGEGAPETSAATWFAALFGGFWAILGTFFLVLFLLGCVLKLMDWMR